MSSIAFTLFGIDVYWYGVCIVCAFLAGIILCKINDGKYGIKFDYILDLSLIVMPLAIIGARLYYVAFNWSYFGKDLMRIIDIRNGGLAIYGGIIGGVIGVYIFCSRRDLKLLNFTDFIAPALALGQAIGRWGNYFNQEAYGIETNLPWKMKVIEGGVTKYVHPTFLYESIGNLIIFITLMIVGRKRKFRGQITYLYIIMYSCIRALIEGLRIDSLMLFNFRISQILSIFLFIVFCIIYRHDVEVCRIEGKKEK